MLECDSQAGQICAVSSDVRIFIIISEVIHTVHMSSCQTPDSHISDPLNFFCKSNLGNLQFSRDVT